MSNKFLKFSILTLFMFFTLPLFADANEGDLRYEVTSVNISGTTITFNGWAFIHRTNNYTTVVYNGKTYATGGDQKILMRTINKTTGQVMDIKSVSGSSTPNYNFYCELVYKKSGVSRGGSSCDYKDYISSYVNECINAADGNGTATDVSSCYYEDIAFSIAFDISDWSFDNDDEIIFEIAASNSNYETKIANGGYGSGINNGGYEYNGDFYTWPEALYISRAAISNLGNDYIIIDESSISDTIEFIASNGKLRQPNSLAAAGYYGTWKSEDSSSGFEGGCTSNIYILANISNYSYGVSNNVASCSSFLGSDCRGTHYYALKIGNKNSGIACPGTNSSSTYLVASGSHVKPTGNVSFMVNLKSKKLCDVVIPSTEDLSCNSSKSFSSTCDELAINTGSGMVDVKIHQEGYVSNILTPDKTYAGGGFSFGITYYNTIKWSYVNSFPGNDIHAIINAVMNSKIKDYATYIAGINIAELKFGGKTIDSSFLVKQCTTSDTNKNYYNKELTVSCTFYIPDSVLEEDGEVIYKSGADNNIGGISNKYYTPLDYIYKNNKTNYSVTAKIVGLNRITDSSAINDSKIEGVAWTGDWDEDNNLECILDLYSLLHKPNGGYNFIYRPIDIYNPFPSRNAGINWFDWYSVVKNQERLESTYNSDNLQYSTTLDNETIANIKNYNKNNNYLDWSSINSNTGNSSFIDDYDYVERYGG